MSADAIVEVLLWGAAIESTLFVFLYPILSPGWRRTFIGWALLTSALALALLLDLSLATKILGREFVARDPIRVTIMSLIFAGTTLKLTALLTAKAKALRNT